MTMLVQIEKFGRCDFGWRRSDECSGITRPQAAKRSFAICWHCGYYGVECVTTTQEFRQTFKACTFDWHVDIFFVKPNGCYSVYKSKVSSYQPFRFIWFQITPSHTMRFSSVIVLAVVAALASSISATPIDARDDECPWYCSVDSQCGTCYYGYCVSTSSFLGFDTRLTCMAVAGTSTLRGELYFCFHIDAVWDAQVTSDWSSWSTCIKKVSVQLHTGVGLEFSFNWEMSVDKTCNLKDTDNSNTVKEGVD